MAEEAWLGGKLEGFADEVMPAAHALVEAIREIRKTASDLSREELHARPHGAASAAFHLRHIAGSTNRLLTYARGEELTKEQFEFLQSETAEDSRQSARELVEQAVLALEDALECCRTVAPEILFDARFVGRKRLPTTVFGLLFHIAEHTARHVGQLTTTARIVRK